MTERRQRVWVPLQLALALMLVLRAVSSSAQTTLPASVRVPSAASSDRVWFPPDPLRLASVAASRLAGLPGAVAALDGDVLQSILARAPLEDTLPAGAAPVVLTLPLPDGRFGRFTVEESPILVPELAARFPQIRTYRGTGLDDPTATARFGWTELGFHAIVLAAGGSLYIDPYAPGDRVNYVSIARAEMPGRADWSCELGSGPLTLAREDALLPISSGTQKRTYRLALAATGEYTAAAGGTRAAALSRMTATMNRVNGIYLRDLAVTMAVSTGTGGDPTALIYTDGATDPYSNNDGFAMLGQNQANLDAVVGNAAYDVGHVFSTGGGGVAYLQAVCADSFKAGGVTGSGNPTGDAFDVDYVAHELGHQFGGNHTFNGTTASCGGGNRSEAHAVEPGSGSTIMAYAGICDGEDTQRNSQDNFSIESLKEITSFLAGGGACAVTTSTGNAVPAVAAGGNYSIPKQTPFVLTGSATDANGDALTYTWEQWDAGAATSSPAAMAVDDGTRALFRSYTPAGDSSRTFPALPFVLDHANVPPETFAGASEVSGVVCSYGTCATGEALPTTTRTLKFQFTARDNRSGGGGVASAPVTVTVDGNAGPFRVTSPNTAVAMSGLSGQTITWDVNSSNTYAAYVDVSLSTDGGQTWPYTLASGVPNDGSQAVTLPNVSSTTARVRVTAAGNIFFDVSDVHFTITAVAPGAFAKSAPSDGGTTVSGRPTLSWGAALWASSYELCIDTVDDGVCGGSFINVGLSTSTELSAWSPGTTYYWQVRASNGVGTTYADGSATAFWRFGTGAEFTSNGNFSGGSSGWLTYATPDMSYIHTSTSGGVLAFHRVAPPPGTRNQATVFQNTGAGLASNTAVAAQFDLGNTDSVRKRISVLILDADFSDLSVCTFWLPPNTPLTTYSMAMHTTRPWTNASIYFYAATAGSGGDYLVDNVSVQLAGGGATPQWTACDDPFAPAASGGADGPSLLTNGDFGSGALTPGWITFGTITAQVTSGVLQFIKPTSAEPAGVVLQATGAALDANTVLTSAFQLGNSSGVRKRVTVILHDLDFSDLSACTFWLPAGQAPSSYSMRAYATKAWANATFSVYPATVGADEWIVADNLSLQQTPAASPLGTECVEPGITWPREVRRTNQ